MKFVRRVLIALLIGLVRLYQWTLSPLLHWLTPGAGCRYLPTCSIYAIEALRQHGPLRGSWLAVRRLLDCHPWGGHGHDPVPKEFPGWWRQRRTWRGAKCTCEDPKPKM